MLMKVAVVAGALLLAGAGAYKYFGNCPGEGACCPATTVEATAPVAAAIEAPAVAADSTPVSGIAAPAMAAPELAVSEMAAPAASAETKKGDSCCAMKGFMAAAATLSEPKAVESKCSESKCAEMMANCAPCAECAKGGKSVANPLCTTCVAECKAACAKAGADCAKACEANAKSCCPQAVAPAKNAD